MLNGEDNELLAHVGPGAPMGEYFRRFWIPSCLSEELPEADGAPLRLRLLGEDLLAFRATDGRVGVVANNCPHRGASMFFGRNEKAGLRCVYHGWKFNLAGECVDMPSEPPESNFKSKVKIKAYPARDVNHMVWIYMGPRETPPPFPEFEILGLPAEN